MSSGILIRALGTLLLIASVSLPSVPDALLGSWSVGVPYDTKPPIGINARQEARLRRLRIVYTKDHLRVCGHDVAIKTVTERRVTEDEFLQERGFLPSVIGFRTPNVLEIGLNYPDAFGACGEYIDPGSDLITDDAGKHVVMEVANDYLPLKKE
jgi:hypothetical protein